MRVLDEAYDTFNKIINDYASSHGLSEEEKEELLVLVNNAYQDKKMTYFLEDKLDLYETYLKNSANVALKERTEKMEKADLNILYFKQLKELMFTNGWKT